MTPEIEVRIMNAPPREVPAGLVSAFEAFSPVVSIDTKRHGPWWNLRECLLKPRARKTTHLLILNDDVVPTPGCVESIQAVARDNRDSLVMLYSYHGVLEKAQQRGVHWLQSYTLTWGCAQLIRVDLVKPFLEFNEKFVRDDWDIDDTRWALWACYRGKPNWIFAPSLVDHMDGESIHRPGKVHRKTAWLSTGPLSDIDPIALAPKEQDPWDYLMSRKHWLKAVPTRPNLPSFPT